MERKQTHIMYGFITGLVIVALSFTVYKADMLGKPGMGMLFLIPFIAGLILNAMAYSKANDGYVTYGNVYGSCFKGTMIITLVAVAWLLLYQYIVPGMKEAELMMVQIKTQESAAKNPAMTSEMMDKSMDFMKKYWVTIMVGLALPTYLGLGAIISAIAAAVVPKKGPRPGAVTQNF